MTEKVAIIIIPGIVTFPGREFNLHAFEPRYRRLVKDSIKNNTRIAVTHGKKVLKRPNESQTTEEIINSNQGLYMPQDVFSAGYGEIYDVTADGRLFVKIKMDKRYKVRGIVQELPYYIADCFTYDDLGVESHIKVNATRNSIQEIIKDLSQWSELESYQQLLEHSFSNDCSNSKLSFELMNTFEFDLLLMQKILESQTAQERLLLIETYLSKAIYQSH